MADTTFEPVAFDSEGATLRGQLYLPKSGAPPHPAIAMAHGLSATTKMAIDAYAKVFADHGIAALVYDHRGLGLSDGEPRQQINLWMQARGYRDAITCLGAREGIDPSRIGTSPSETGTFALLRLTATLPSAAQIRHMYETERRMFEANAKCLLQSGTTDAVLDVSIDPITGKVGVVQTDDEVLFDGLVIDEDPALPAGAANWEHVARYGGDRLVITNANLYADIAAKDIRGELEKLRGKVSALPKGPDLGRANAMLNYDEATATTYSSMNVKSVTVNASGNFDVNFEVPFKSKNYFLCGAGEDQATVGFDYSLSAPDRCRIKVRDIDGNLEESHNTIVWFGELKNE